MKYGLFLILVAGFQGVVSAAIPSCFDPSPRYAQLGEQYFELNRPIKLTEQRERDLLDLLESLEGDWEGSGTETLCSGTDDDPQQELREFSSEVVISVVSKGSLQLEMTQEGGADRTRWSENLYLFPRAFLRKLEQSGGQVRALVKERVGSAAGGSRLLEMEIEMRVSGDQLNLEIVYYANGVFEHQIELTLRRR